MFRAECEAEGIPVTPDDDGNPARLGRFQVMGVLSSLAEEKSCSGTSRLEKIENLTKMFLYPSGGSAEAVTDDLMKHECLNVDEEMEVGDAIDAAKESKHQATAADATAAAAPSYSRPLNRSHTPVSRFQRNTLEVPDLPYLAPKLLRSPAKNVHISQRHSKAVQWNMPRAAYDAESVLSTMTKSARKSDDRPSHTATSSPDAWSRSCASKLTCSQPCSLCPQSPHSPTQSTAVRQTPVSPRQKQGRVDVEKQKLAAQRFERESKTVSPCNDRVAADSLLAAAAAAKAANGTAHVLLAILHM